ncbi:MAG: TetR/AcrR family transcriptional regulator [Phormidesmis sp. FL-bin-119]|nr:TetR/AcrR family transcriptional regulator [Pedobacter sp.]
MMKSRQENKHMGEALEMIIRRRGWNISELAKSIGADRRSFYYWFKQEELKESVLQRISEVVDYDLSLDFPSFSPHSPEIQKFTELVQPQQNTYWKDKYVDLLEQYSKLLTNTAMGSSQDKMKKTAQSNF